MSSIREIRNARLKKLRILEETFENAYPSSVSKTHTIEEVKARFSEFIRSKKTLTLAGRVRAFRPFGGSFFFDIEENGHILQGYAREDDMDSNLYTVFCAAIDIGDFIEITGKPYLTKKRERSLLITRWKPLSKSLLPLPEKWHGLQDIEERYRERSLDLLSNQQVREHFITRTRVVSFIRSYLDREDFLEVETSMLQGMPGGASARPFITHHNALNIDLYLRIAPEIDLKKLLVGGYTRVYEIGRSFRNEGIDATHNPEFTTLEAYMAFSDYRNLMKFTETLFKKLLSNIFNKKECLYGENKILFKKSFRVLTFYDALRQYALIPNVETASKEEVTIAAKRVGLAPIKHATREEIMEDIFRKAVRRHLIQPTFVIHHPTTLLPLAKRSEKDSKLVESFQLYIGGLELVKGFSELNNPIDQKERLEEQEKLRMLGNLEAQPLDTDFIECLEYGMPPASGFAIGIDRLMLLISNKKNIREVIFFPTLRPRG